MSQSQKNNLLQKLHLRQMYGKIQTTSVAEETKVFSRLPGRLAFFIRDAVPHSALTSGHVFLGFSRCGQFLLSYTQTNTENDQVGDTEIFFTNGLNIFQSVRPQFQLLLPPSLVALHPLLQGSESGRGDSIHQPGGLW